MAVSFQLPSDLEQHLRHDVDDLDAAAKEALLVELYRRDKLTHFELSQALELGRIETEGLLKKHNVTEDLPTQEEISEDLTTLRRLLDK
jgi:hypothetical protein